MTEVSEPVSLSDLSSQRVNSSVGISPLVEDKVEPGQVASEKNWHALPSEIADNKSIVGNPSPTIDLGAAYRIAREVGRTSETDAGGSDMYPDGGIGNSNEDIRLAVESAWSPPPSCYRAYSGMGLLAIPFLLKDTITDSGCEW